MDWNKGYSALYYMTEVDPITWKDLDRLELTGGSISRSMTGLRQSADVDCINYELDREKYIRIYLDTRQSGSAEHVPLFTGLATSPGRDIKGSWYQSQIDCYSVLKPIDDVILSRGWFALSGMSGGDILKQLLTPARAPIEIEPNAPLLEYSIVAEDGETNLTMIDRVLLAINWELKIAGDGTIKIGPYNEKSLITFDPLTYDVIENEIKITSDWYSCPNVFMATNNEITGIARDISELSPLSIQNRGREVWMYESGANMMAGESIDQYAERRLKEEQQYLLKASYDRRFIPDIMPGDYVSFNYAKQRLVGDYMIESQSISLGHSARTSEDVIGVGTNER